MTTPSHNVLSNEHPTPIKLTPLYAWKMAQIVIPLFYLPLAIFSIAFKIKLNLRHPSIVNLPHCVYNDPVYPIRIHLLLFTHHNEHTKTHNVHHDFASITCEINFHMLRKHHEHLHKLHSSTFQTSCQHLVQIHGMQPCTNYYCLINTKDFLAHSTST